MWDRMLTTSSITDEINGNERVFLKNRENLERREDTSVLVNRTISITMVGCTVSSLPSVLFGHKKSCTQS